MEPQKRTQHDILVVALAIALVLVALAGCAGRKDAQDTGPPTSADATAEDSGAEKPVTSEKGEETMAFNLTSSAFAPGDSIPKQYSCDGDDTSPPLTWGDPPANTQAFALIMDDPDAPVGTWVHWVLYDLPPQTRSLDAGVPPTAELPDGARHGKNSWKRFGYGGPCPPGGTHRYFFKLYALDAPLGLPAGATKKEVTQAMQGHILAQAELMGTYRR